jgi:hypothetical protein
MEKKKKRKRRKKKEEKKSMMEKKKKKEEEKGGQMFVRMSHDHDGIGWEKVEGEERRREKEMR